VIPSEHFSGRQWVFAAIDEWLSAAGGSRVFLLAGGPGTGKTAIAARLVQASRGEVNVSAHASLGSGALSFAYFCQATRPTTLLPLRFVQSMSATLASRFPAFRAGLEQQASQQILISAPVSVGGPVHEGAHVVGANIEQVTIEIRGTDARAMFDEAVRKPLWAHAPQPAAEPS
jgi:hypothetical protein